MQEEAKKVEEVVTTILEKAQPSTEEVETPLEDS